MSIAEEVKPLFDEQRLRSDGVRFPAPLGLSWRLFHWMNYIIGGVTFTIGSYQYFPAVSGYVLGAWLFTIGSFGFAVADFNEWWTNNRVGCFYYADIEEIFESSLANKNFQPINSVIGKFQRAENGLNFFLSLTGSALYLFGSILFIPDLNSIVAGTYIFILGSAVIFTAQSWKLWRVFYNREEKSFKFSHFLEDLPGTVVDLTAGLGGLCYLIGSVIFLPQYDVSEAETYQAAVWFQLGGLLYLLSGLALGYRYFCTQNYPH